MGAPFGITLVDLSDLPSIVTSPTYTEILHDTLGAAGTDADGTPSAIADLNAHVNAFEADVNAGGTDLADVFKVANTLDQRTANELAANLPGISAAGDRLLGEVDNLTSTPAPPPPALPPPSNNPKVNLPGMRVGQAEAQIEVGGATWTSLEIEPQVFNLAGHDPAIFHWRRVHTEQPTGHGDKILTDTWYLLVNPTKAGTFAATVEETDQTSDPQVVTDKDYVVTITA